MNHSKGSNSQIRMSSVEETGLSNKSVLINCDMGESFGLWKMGQDEHIMPHIDLANIACGYHAGDPTVMAKTLTLALQHDVKPGAHPGYPDKQGFGRRTVQLQPDELQNIMLYQIGALSAIATSLGVQLFHVKPHGALYNDMMRNESILRTVMAAVSKLNSNLKLVIQATPDWQRNTQIASEYDIELLFEAFSDRGYQSSGLLVPRTETGAVLNAESAIEQSQFILQKQQVTSLDGHSIPLHIDTLCIHGDGEHALNIAEALS